MENTDMRATAFGRALGYSVNRRAAPGLPMFTYVAEKVDKLPTW